MKKYYFLLMLFIGVFNSFAQTFSTSLAPVTSTGADDGWFNSLRVVNGTPAFSYYDNTNEVLKYVRATNALGTTWGTPVSIETTGFGIGTGGNSLQIVNGNPAISYKGSNNRLKYVRATNASGTTWGVPVNVIALGFGVQDNSLQIVNGNPAIAYYDGDLKYVRATNASGTSWGTPVSIDITGDVGRYATLQIVNGNPAISYYDSTNGDLKYVRATNASGTSWGTPVSIDVVGVVGEYASFQIVNGIPAISYYDWTNQDLKYVSATDASGTLWDIPVIVDGAGGYFSSLQIVKGRPAISYTDHNGVFKYVRATNASGTSWADPIALDVTEAQFISMTPIGDGVGIVYRNLWMTLPNFILGSPTVPTFTAVSPICSGGSLSALPTTSNNSITGTWSPALNNTITTEYTFTPTAGLCATTAIMTITVNPILTPTFTAVAPIYFGGSVSALPTTSNNGITGTWSPALNTTATTEYTFTPSVGLCATTTTLTITVYPYIDHTIRRNLVTRQE